MPLSKANTAKPRVVAHDKAKGSTLLKRRISLEQCVVFFVVLDLFLVSTLSLVPNIIWSSVPQFNPTITTDENIAIILSVGLFTLLAQNFRVYQIATILDARVSIRPLMTALLATFAILLFLGAATKTSQTYSRLWFFSWALLACVVIPIARVVGVQLVRKQLDKGAYVFRAMSVGVFCEPLTSDEIASRTGGQARTDLVLRLKSFDELEQLSGTIARDEIDQIYIATPWVDAPALLQRLQILRRLAAEVFVLPDDPRVHTHQLGISVMVDRLSLKAVERPIDGWDLWFKRAQDVIVSSVILLFLAPVLAVIALAIRIESPGPILFRQRRVGFNGRTFELLKFRSMYLHPADAGALQQTARADPRVTRVGRFIRSTSLDELPQFVNVLQGRMSVVGPRPHALKTQAQGHDLEEVADQYAARHRVKPGLTGWAQVNGFRGELDSVEKLRMRIKFDIEYIENWSTGFDMKIILKTVLLILHDRHAY